MKLWIVALVALAGWQVVNSGGRLSGVGLTVTITVPASSPTYDAGTASTLAVSGSALSDRTVTGCTYSNSLGGSGSATGTTSWSIASVALTVGSNVITVTCTNTEGTPGTDVITVTRSSTAYPDDTNTGVPSGTSLTAYSGPNPITADGTTITAKTFTSCPLDIEAINVTITNSFFNCSGQNAIYIDDQGMYVETSSGANYALTLTDSEIKCGTTATGVGKTGVQEAYAHLVRVKITHCENGTSVNQRLLVEDSYIHDFASNGGGAHSDGGEAPCAHWQGGGGPGCLGGANPGYHRGSRNITWTHNTVFGMSALDTAFETSALIFNHGGNPDVNVLVQLNLFAGGANTLYCVQDGVAGTNFQVLNNHFTTRFKASVGDFAPSVDCSDETLSGNVYHETGLPITLSQLLPFPLAPNQMRIALVTLPMSIGSR